MAAPITLKDIAREVGVTTMTVSSSLRGTGRISPQMRQKIIVAANNLGYVKNAAARSVRSGRFSCISLVLGYAGSNLASGLLSGIHEQLARHEQHLMLTVLPDEKLTDPEYVPAILRETMSDGLLIKYDTFIPARMVSLIQRHHIPSIWINSKHATDCIYPDEVEAGRKATEHLLELGHRRVVYMHYGGQSHYNVSDRYEGYCQAMRARGLKPCWVDRDLGEIPRPQRVGVIRHLLSQPDRPTAFVINSTTTVKMLVLTATELRLRIPHDLSLITFETKPNDELGFAFTSMINDDVEIGRQAVEMLLQKIAKPQKNLPSRVTHLSLFPGATCARSAKSRSTAPPSDHTLLNTAK